MKDAKKKSSHSQQHDSEDPSFAEKQPDHVFFSMRKPRPVPFFRITSMPSLQTQPQGSVFESKHESLQSSTQSKPRSNPVRSTQLDQLLSQIGFRTAENLNLQQQLTSLPLECSEEVEKARSLLQGSLDAGKHTLIQLLEKRIGLLSEEIEGLRLQIGPNPVSLADQPNPELEALGHELIKREQERNQHQQQLFLLKRWQVRTEMGAIEAEIAAINRELMNLPSDLANLDVQLLLARRTELEARHKTLVTTLASTVTGYGDSHQRMAYVMGLLVNQYQYPVSGAAGLVGNLAKESGVLPNRIEGSAEETPLNAPSFAGKRTDFTAEQVMNCSVGAKQGPKKLGIGLAQWTTESRRAGLFKHEFESVKLGAAILFDMDAQVNYLVSELRNKYPQVNRVLMKSGISVNDASDEVVYRFEVPQSVLDGKGQLRPRTDPNVQKVFQERRVLALQALRAYQNTHS